MFKKIGWSALMLAAGVNIGLVVEAMTEDKPANNPVVVQVGECPTEDSCKLDFRAGRWYVTPTIP